MNQDNQQNRHVISPAGTRVSTIVLAFTLVAGMVVFLRVFTRLVLTRGAGLEDISIVLAMAISIGLAVTIADQVTHGLGRHSSRLNADDREDVLKAFWESVWIYNLTLTLTKVSILTQYLRIFPIKWFRQVCFGLLVGVVGYGAWALFSNVFICNPVAFSWDKSIPNGHCMNQMTLWFTNAGINIAQDVVILLLPMPVIQTLQIPRAQKKGLVVMLALGASVTIISIIRLYSLDDISNSTDVPFDNIAHATLSAVEANVGIICACLPAMRPLFALIVPEYFSATTQYTKAAARGLDKQKRFQTPASSTGKNTIRTNTPRSGTPRQALRPTISRNSSGILSVAPNSRPHTPGQMNSTRPGTPLQIPRPTISRTSTGMFSVDPGSRPHTSGRGSAMHSRSGSNISIDIAAMKLQPPCFQGRIDPLRMSPVSPNIPALPVRSSSRSPLASYSHSRQGSDHHASIAKPLPITPLP